MAAVASPAPERQSAQERLITCLAAAPFNLPRIRPVLWRGSSARVVVGTDLKPISQMGPSLQEAAQLAAAVHLSGAEILCLPWPLVYQPDPEALMDWLGRQASEAGSPLEQVIILGVAHPSARDPTSPQSS